MKRRRFIGLLALGAVVAPARAAFAHHEALFGPQASLAVESEAFVSVQSHEHVFGSGATLDRETTFIFSGGVTPFRRVPWSVSLVVPYTYEDARAPAGDQTGPFSSCGGCLARENLLVSTSYRFDFKRLQQATGKDGNFALVSGSLEPPTGEKDYAAFDGPWNGILAAMAGVEWSRYSAVGLGYYRLNERDGSGSTKGNNWLAGLGFAYTLIDEASALLSFQLGIAAELHERDVLAGAPVADSGGWEIFASPTVVWAPAAHVRLFGYVSLPLTQSYRSASQEDAWRGGVGIIYSFDRPVGPRSEEGPATSGGERS